MFNAIFASLNTNSGAITALSVFGAALVWILKMPYEKYSKETVSIAKWEKLVALNEAAVRDNISFMIQWLGALAASRPFNCHFEPLLIDDLSNNSISDLKLVNKLLKINYMSKRTSDDLLNLYKSYWDTIPKISDIADPIVREEGLKRYHDTVASALTGIKTSAEVLHGEFIPVLAHLQVAGRVRFHSIFGYSNWLLLRDVWPRPNKSSIDEKLKLLKKEMEQKGFSINKNGSER